MPNNRNNIHATPGFEVLGNEKQQFTDRTRLYLQRRVKETDEIPLTLQEENELVGQARKEKLGEWLATGICGNNITSSALYVVALCSVPAGKFAPVALLCIAGLLYLFRRIYEEVVTALPVNGGTYNLLLNTTTKGNASIAACLTMLSYVTTAVISSTSAMRYLHTLCDNCEEFDVIIATCVTLSIAAFLNLMGITESAVVALVIFLFHMLSMVLLVGASLFKAIVSMPTVNLIAGTSLLATGATSPALVDPVSFPYNFSSNSHCTCYNDTAISSGMVGSQATETVSMFVYNWVHTSPAMGIAGAIYFGFSSALLGISGFESSSNYVENQQDGVFPKTLRNMWIAVTFINPSIAFLAQCLLPVNEIAGQAEEGALLSMMAEKAAGPWLKYWIVIDATLVLVGAVITAFVGFTGLSHRMTVDRCLPQVFLSINSFRKTRHWIIIGFWVLTTLLVLQTQGNVEILAGVYTVAFLSVMFSFTVGNMLLKLRRSDLPTPVHVKWRIVLLASFAVMLGLIGNIVSRPRSLSPLLIFGVCFIIPVQIMLNRRKVLSIIVAITSDQDDRDAKTKKLDLATKSFAEKLELDDLFMEAMRNASDLMDADRATLWLIDHVNNELWSKVAIGIPTIRVPLGVGIVGWVTTHKKTLNIPDAYKDSRFNPAVDKKTGYKTDTILCMPIYNFKGTMVGVMQIINKIGKNAVFTREDEIVLTDFCSRIAVAAEKVQELGTTQKDMKRILRRLRKQLESTKAIETMLKSASVQSQLDHLFVEAIQVAHKLVSADRGTLWLVDDRTNELWTRIAEGIEPIRIPKSKGIVGWVATTGDVLNIEDAYKDPRFNNSVDKKTGYKTTQILCTPIISSTSGKLIGVVQLINKVVKPSKGGRSSPALEGDNAVSEFDEASIIHFTKTDEETLMNFCKGIADTVELSQNSDATREDLRKTVRDLEQKLAQVESKMVTSYDDLFENTVESARKILQADRCSLWIADSMKNELWSIIAQGIEPIRVSNDKGLVGACFHTGNSLSIPNAYQDHRFNHSVDKKTGYKTKSILCAPIFSKDKVIGVLQAINKVCSHTDAFTKDDEVAAKRYCTHLAKAVLHCRNKDSGQEELLESSMEIKKFTLNAAANLAEQKIKESQPKEEKKLSGLARFKNAAKKVAEVEKEKKRIQEKKRTSVTSKLRIQLQEETEDYEETHQNSNKTKGKSSCYKCFLFKRIINNWANRSLIALTQKPLVYFTKDDSPKALANAVRYVLANEQRCWIKFVRVYSKKSDVPVKVPIVYQYLLDSHPNLIIEYVAMVGKFGPAIVRELSLREHIPSTFMFMGSFGEKFEYTFTEMGGLRLITENTATYYQPTENKSKAAAAAKIQSIFRRNKVKKRFSALNDTSRPESPRSASPPLDKMFKETMSVKKIGSVTNSDDSEDNNDIIRAPSQQSFHGTSSEKASTFNVLAKRSSFTTDDVVLEMARTSSNKYNTRKTSIRKMSD